MATLPPDPLHNPREIPQYQQLITKQLQHVVQHSDIRWEHVPGSAARFNLLLPFCYELLHWQVEFQRIAGVWVPDFIFSDSTFNPLLPSNAEPLSSKIISWKLEDERQLLQLMRSVVRRFTQHQKALICDAAEGDKRLQREVDRISGEGSTQDWQMLYVHGHPGKAVFVANVGGVDLSQLRPFLDRNWASPGECMPDEALLKLQKMVFLKAVFQISSTSPPSLSFRMPEHLAALIGPTTFPSWDSRTSLTEFLPSAIACLQEQSKTSGNLAMQRQDLLDELPKTKLGPALESDIAAARFASYQVMHDGFEWSVNIELPPNFPENMPRLTIERKSSLPTQRRFSEYPWSPRWSTKEMAKRISSFVSGEIKANAQRRPSEDSYEAHFFQ